MWVWVSGWVDAGVPVWVWVWMWIWVGRWVYTRARAHTHTHTHTHAHTHIRNCCDNRKTLGKRNIHSGNAAYVCACVCV